MCTPAVVVVLCAAAVTASTEAVDVPSLSASHPPPTPPPPQAIDILIPVGFLDATHAFRAARSALRHVRGARHVFFVGDARTREAATEGASCSQAAVERNALDCTEAFYSVVEVQQQQGGGGGGGGRILWANEYVSARATGWVRQQLLKLIGPLRLRTAAARVLVMDADLTWLRPVEFASSASDGKAASLLARGGGFDTVQYFDFPHTLLGPQAAASATQLSGVAHHMVFDRRVLRGLMRAVVGAGVGDDNDNGDDNDGALTLQFEERFASYAETRSLLSPRPSEYQLYFAYALAAHPDRARIRDLAFVLRCDRHDDAAAAGFAYAVCHNHFRAPCGARRSWGGECAGSSGGEAGGIGGGGSSLCVSAYPPAVLSCVDVPLARCAAAVSDERRASAVPEALAALVARAVRERATNLLHAAAAASSASGAGPGVASACGDAPARVATLAAWAEAVLWLGAVPLADGGDGVVSAWLAPCFAGTVAVAGALSAAAGRCTGASCLVGVVRLQPPFYAYGVLLSAGMDAAWVLRLAATAERESRDRRRFAGAVLLRAGCCFLFCRLFLLPAAWVLPPATSPSGSPLWGDVACLLVLMGMSRAMDNRHARRTRRTMLMTKRLERVKE
eukprot:Rhum_TRINITY_DN14688_c0_g1::Rhum_TRINITY_DN14688_c0_g1_i1::g.108863::m.108863